MEKVELSPEKMVINAALMRLVPEGVPQWDEVAARTVITCCDKIPTASKVRVEAAFQKKERGYHLPVLSPLGRLFHITSAPSSRRIELQFGNPTLRVGAFKVYKVEEGILEFCHFWASDLTTQGLYSDPVYFRLGYNPKTKEPYYFAVWKKKVLLRVPLLGGSFVIYLHFLDPVHVSGKKPRGKGIGIAIEP